MLRTPGCMDAKLSASWTEDVFNINTLLKTVLFAGARAIYSVLQTESNMSFEPGRCCSLPLPGG